MPKINSSRLVKKDLFTQFALSNFLKYFKKNLNFQTAWESIFSELFEADPVCLAKFLTFAFANRNKLQHLILVEKPDQTKECLTLIKVLIKETLKREEEKTLIPELLAWGKYFYNKVLSKTNLSPQSDKDLFSLLQELYHGLFIIES